MTVTALVSTGKLDLILLKARDQLFRGVNSPRDSLPSWCPNYLGLHITDVRSDIMCPPLEDGPKTRMGRQATRFRTSRYSIAARDSLYANDGVLSVRGLALGTIHGPSHVGQTRMALQILGL